MMRGMLLNCLSMVINSLVSLGSCRWMSEFSAMLLGICM